MRIPVIDNMMNHISDPRTKDGMKEVLSCFYSNNMRSAVVMLYATVVSDLYYKISDLVSIYNDAGAIQIKSYVDNEWQNSPKSPAWETELPKQCWEKNKILKNDSYAHFCSLQQERNLCAHPVITGNKLYQPSAATVQGMIIDMLRGVLCLPSFLSKDFINTFTDDIESSSNSFHDIVKLKEYIKAKYLDKIDNEHEEYALFRKLWKFVFKNIDDQSKRNRIANESILTLIYERNQAFCDAEIAKDADLYGSAVSVTDKSCLQTFVIFANNHLNILSSMPDDFMIKFKQHVNNDNCLRSLAFCLSKNPVVHAKTAYERVGSDIANYMYDYLCQNATQGDAIDFIIDLYGKSLYFDDADDYFDNVVEPRLDEMSESQLEKLISQSNKNYQIYERKRWYHSRYMIKHYMLQRNKDFDYTSYDKFC